MKTRYKIAVWALVAVAGSILFGGGFWWWLLVVVSRLIGGQVRNPHTFYHSVGNSHLLPCLCLHHRWNTLDINRIKQYGYDSDTIRTVGSSTP